VTGGSYTWIDTQAKPGEASEHLLPTIRLSDLCIDQRRVSAKAYFECHSKGACPALGSGAACARIDADGFANCITRSAAEAYCKSLKARLPTEEEWEVAVTAAEAGRLAPGSQLANRETRLAVRRVLQTSNDADVSLGNVGADDTWEWTASAHNRVPGGPANSGTAVIRRRGRAPEEQSGWTLYRHAADPASQSAKVGFRCVR
jgi:formylglycine-generating enzyme required for sulfatase activity